MKQIHRSLKGHYESETASRTATLGLRNPFQRYSNKLPVGSGCHDGDVIAWKLYSKPRPPRRRAALCWLALPDPRGLRASSLGLGAEDTQGSRVAAGG